jgi:predicted acylesterase/phospholipase RssA
MNKRIGIVLSGGGAKGAFEVGVLKVLLDKINKDKDVLAGISGTSIGALNGAFVASGQFEELEKIWLSWTLKNCPLIQSDWYGNIVSLITKGYMYNPEPVKAFFQKSLSVSSLFNSPIKYINTQVRLGDGELRLGGNVFQRVDQDLAIREVMASMAFIPGTPSVKIDGQEYGDGGFRDTVPVKALIENVNAKFDKIYIINVNTKERVWNPALTKNDTSGLVSKLKFIYDDILWDEANRSDIEIGMLKFWDNDNYQVIYPEKVNLSTTDFDTTLIKEAYEHGIKIAQKVL